MEKNNLDLRQLFEKESSTYTYLLADKKTKEAILIDPVNLTFDRDVKLLEELGYTLKYVLETHVHADHITSASKLRDKLGAKVVLSKASNAQRADIYLENNEELEFGEFKIKAISTPGHTDGCLSYEVLDMLFTGDALLIRSVGRTDFQQGSPENLYSSIQELYKRDDATIVYPAHNYNGLTNTTIGEEKKFNQFANENLSKEEFIKLQTERNLPLPQKIKESVPANMVCGGDN